MSGKENGTVLRVERLSKMFGGVVALNDVTFEIKKGDILGVIGPNGSGKTTLINCITGFVKPTHGGVYFNGTDISGFTPHKIANMGIGRTFQVVRPYHTLPAYKNLIAPLFSARARHFPGSGGLGNRGGIAIDILEDVGFERDARVPYKPAGDLPLGYLKRLELARCIALRSDVMILDEVFSGLSAAEIASLVPLLERLNMDGVTLIMVEHRLKELFTLASKVVVLSFGVKLFEGNSDDALKDEKVKEAYFGKGKEGMI
ncbi:ABC transporter, ATP-binding protein [delta proteobacterium NaphS2]|nr:ABC transporter, ATP-binding protein [delta proteobacterium NaphS2]